MSTVAYTPAPLAPAGPTKPRSLTRRGVGIVVGILLLLTLVIPYGLDAGDKPVMSWDILKDYKAAGLARETLAFLISAWAVGLAVLVLASAMRRLALSIAYLLVAAGLGVLFYFTYLHTPLPHLLSTTMLPTQFNSQTIRRLTDYALSVKALAIIGMLAPAVFLILIGCRLRLGGAIIICIFQILIAAAFTALEGVAFWRACWRSPTASPSAPRAAGPPAPHRC